MGILRIIQGAIGLAKATAGIHPAPVELVIVRRKLCARCPKITRKTEGWPLSGTFGPYGCSECRCFVEPKTRLRSESCPLGKW